MSLKRSGLFHYTCWHGHEGIMRDGVIIAASSLANQRQRRRLRSLGLLSITSQVVWMTTIPHIIPLNVNQAGLGMSSIEALLGERQCDRTVHRYEITEEHVEIVPWVQQRKVWPIAVVAALESLDGVRPDTWWISRGPLHAHYAPHRKVAA